MTLRIMKLHIEAETSVNTEPNSTKFFYITDAETAPDSTLSIDAADFFDDTGTAVTELPELEEHNSYYNVYINGVLQMDDISVYTPGETQTGSLDINVPDEGESILEGVPVVLEVVNFTPTSDTDIAT
ncbi:DUF4183 domain-containing protein [Alkalibacillus haloalkaliphilus]|uniref:DUF4183 domain-containing protein n=1 Tax=Alkalibacillus haloalkaliphilus TaxID=94136 RepID=A0A511W3Y8_9BACI|nr:DUF4183 domain-containing protein [Alkalibacillus haloalkaliphilus]GEN45058.1 hypothetical protein AHA02nite_08340 [Alkalibacillus haloalkaliphilus]